MSPRSYGRRLSTPDARDYKLAHYLTPDPLVDALAMVQRSYITSRWVKRWAALVTERVQAVSPAPTPPPIPSPTPKKAIVWKTEAPLDQGITPHCVGFGAAQWGNTLPIDDHFTDADGDAIYYECKDVDGESRQENGSSARSAAKVLQNRGRLKTYAFAASLDEARAWVDEHGPVMFATDWYEGMEEPDEQGYVHPTGQVLGGHFYVIVGDLPDEDAILCLNSWGEWGQHGLFKISNADAQMLHTAGGELLAAVELP